MRCARFVTVSGLSQIAVVVLPIAIGGRGWVGERNWQVIPVNGNGERRVFFRDLTPRPRPDDSLAKRNNRLFVRVIHSHAV